MLPYEILDHTADTGIEAQAASFPALIQELATGMFALMARVEPCRSDESITIEVSAPTKEDLVVEVLSELLYEAEVEDLVLCDFRSRSISSHRIRVEARGVPTSEIEVMGPPVKAVTYHHLTVEKTGDRWLGRVYFDV